MNSIHDNATPKLDVVVITGLSGAGKTTALGILEDCGYYPVDNLPLQIIDKFLDLFEGNKDINKVALVVDSREASYPTGLLQIRDCVKKRGHNIRVLFIFAQKERLLRRYSETRRPHPLMGPELHLLEDAIDKDIALSSDLQQIADLVLDSSNLNIHQLRDLIRTRLLGEEANKVINILSFGFKHGLPPESNYVFDLRHIPNPFFVEQLREKTGMDPEVSDWLHNTTEFQHSFKEIGHLLKGILPMHHQHGLGRICISFGCTGGQHRSVAMAKAVYDSLSVHFKDSEINLINRDIHRTRPKATT